MFELQFKWVETQPNFFLFLSEKNMKCKIIIFTPIVKCYIQQLGQFWGQLSKFRPNHHNILTQHIAILLVKTCFVYLATCCNMLPHVGCCWLKYLIVWPELYSAVFKKHNNNFLHWLSLFDLVCHWHTWYIWLDNIAVDLKSQTMIPLSVEFRRTTSAAEINSSPPGRNAMSCTWPKNAE